MSKEIQIRLLRLIENSKGNCEDVRCSNNGPRGDVECPFKGRGCLINGARGADWLPILEAAKRRLGLDSPIGGDE